MILLENTGFFKNKADALADYMGSLPDYLVLIFVEEEVDKRNRMYKAVQKQEEQWNLLVRTKRR